MNERPVMTPKEFSDLIGRSPKWVAKQCRLGRLPTLPPHTRPYLLPKNTLMRATDLEKKS